MINYLDIIIASLITDVIFMFVFLVGIFKSKDLVNWYKKIGLGAVLSDVTIIMLGITGTIFLYPHIFKEYNLINFIILAVAIQISHDLIFGYIIKYIPTGNSNILNIFKSYVKNASFNAIKSDSAMIVSAILIMTYIKDFSTDLKFYILVFTLYIMTYLLYSF